MTAGRRQPDGIIFPVKRMLFPEDFPGIPAYARLETADETGFTDLVWVVTIVEILRMDSLVFGIADVYTEEFQSRLGDNASHRIVTSGILEDGTLSWAHCAHGSATSVPGVEVGIQFRYLSRLASMRNSQIRRRASAPTRQVSRVDSLSSPPVY
jgi:hypothetical protein